MPKQNMKEKIEKNYQLQRADLLKKAYVEENQTISIFTANIMVFVTALPFVVFAFWVYWLVWGGNFVNSLFFSNQIFLFMIAIIFSIPIHEGIHGLFWSFSCKKGFKSIYFGVMWKFLTPYCHCKEPLTWASYMIGVLAPFFVLGIVPSIIAIFSQNLFLLFFGGLNILLAGGDTTIAAMLVKHKRKKAIFLDHPTDCGFMAFYPGNKL